jgi:hypothetical protein
MSERITRRLSKDCVELFPDRALPMKVYQDETDIAYRMSDTMWELVNKLCDYENLEDQLKAKGIAINADAIASNIISSVDDLSPKMLEAAYRKRELEYRTEDARRQIEEQVDDDDPVTKAVIMEAADVLAERFIDNYDCNVSENQLWSNVISQYIETDMQP